MWSRKQLLGALTLVGSVALITYAQTVILPMFFGVFIGSIRVTLANWLYRNTKVSYGIWSGVIITFVLLVLIAIFVVPGVFLDSGSVWTYIVTTAESIFNAVSQRLPELLPESISSAVMGGTSRIISGVMNATTFGTQVLLTLFYSFAFLIGYPQLVKEFYGELQFGAVKLPGREAIRQKSINYLGGLTKMVIIMSILYSLVLYSLGVPKAGFIAFGAAFLTYIPTVGTFVGIVGASLITYGLTNSLMTAILVFLALEIVQMIDQYYITPRVIGSAVQLNVVASVFFITIFGWLWGLGGIFLALWLGGLLVDTLKRNDADQRYIDLLT